MALNFTVSRESSELEELLGNQSQNLHNEKFLGQRGLNLVSVRVTACFLRVQSFPKAPLD